MRDSLIARNTNPPQVFPFPGPSTGGAVWSNGELTLVNTTITGNTAGFGAALYVTGGSTATVVHSTIAGNVATDGSAVSTTGSSTIRFRGTIVADACDGGGAFASDGHNLLDAAAGCGLTEPTDLLDATPGLGALDDHGGPVDTLGLLADGDGIDAGAVACELGGGDPLLADARGVARRPVTRATSAPSSTCRRAWRSPRRWTGCTSRSARRSRRTMPARCPPRRG